MPRSANVHEFWHATGAEFASKSARGSFRAWFCHSFQLAGVVAGARHWPRGTVCVPKTSSTSCGQAVFVDQATYASLSSDAVLSGIDWLG
jgi:hypothetical protein